MRKAKYGYLFILPLMAGCLLFYAVPFIFVIWNSLSEGSGASQIFVGLDNYKQLLKNDMFLLAFGNTMKFLTIGLPLILILSYLIALLLKKQSDRFRVLKSVFLFPYIMPVIGTVLLVELLFSKQGTINGLLQIFGCPLVDWLESPYAFLVVLLLYLWKNTGYGVILLLAGLVTIPSEQYSAADLDGAAAWQKFWYITTSQMWYSVFITVVFSVINAFKCFREIFLVGGEHPNEAVYMLQHFINNSFNNLNYQRLAVASVMLFLVIMIVFLFLYTWVTHREGERE